MNEVIQSGLCAVFILVFMIPVQGDAFIPQPCSEVCESDSTHCAEDCIMPPSCPEEPAEEDTDSLPQECYPGSDSTGCEGDCIMPMPPPCPE